MDADTRRLSPGALVNLEQEAGSGLGVAMFNPHSLIAARVLDRNADTEIDAGWIGARLLQANALRARVCDGPFHRLVHAEADRLPGLIIDRYDDVFVLQMNTAGMDRLTSRIVGALKEMFAPRAIVARNDAPARRLEGLPETVALLHGTCTRAEVREGGLRILVDPMAGQKTGWFFDQRPNRDRVATLADGASVLDVFCHTGAFGLRTALAGARSALLVDSSAPALEMAQEAVEYNGLGSIIRTRRGDAFEVMTALAQADERFDIVVCDPPAFARSRKDAGAGLRAYARMARLAATLVTPGGFLFVASCSHHVPLEPWAESIAQGLHRAGREGQIIATTGAGPDHPVHPHLPETAYLKAQLIRVL